MLDGNYIDLSLDQFKEYSEYVPAEQIESAGVLRSLISKILMHEGTLTIRPVDIGREQRLYKMQSKFSDELLAKDPEILARERELDDFRKTDRQLFQFDAMEPLQIKS